MARRKSNHEGLWTLFGIGIAIFSLSGVVKKCNDSDDRNSKSMKIHNEKRVINFGEIGKEQRTCKNCGFVYDVFDATRTRMREGLCPSCYNKKHGIQNISSNGNEYSRGYNEGYEDALNGNEYDDSNGNGQYRKGYEDGYEDGR